MEGVSQITKKTKNQWLGILHKISAQLSIYARTYSLINQPCPKIEAYKTNNA
jgi:hypothetical protein